MNLNVMRNCWTRRGLAAAGLACGIAFGQESSELVGLINAFRSEPQSCQGERINAVGPLAPDAALARVKPGASGNLLKAAREQGYQAARIEAIPPEETIKLLNSCYPLMFDAISSQGGVVNQMIGDGLMAICGAPLPLADAPLAAVRYLHLYRRHSEYCRPAGGKHQCGRAWNSGRP